jgi:hypothetical protein
MHSPTDLNKILHRKGLDPNTPYIGVVVDDNDPEQLSRVRVRLEVFQDSIEDTKLPWAVPEGNNHPQGLQGGDTVSRTGTQNGIPLRGNKVAVYFRHGGDANNPSYGPVPFDMQNTLPEFETNYPYRLGHKLYNGFTYINDTKTGEVFLHTAGDLNLTILGDVNQTVVGNLQQVITDSENDIPGYLLNAPETVLSQLSANPQGKIAFQGFYGGSQGNMHTIVKNNYTVDVGGNMQEKIGGKYERTVSGKITDKTNASMDLKASGQTTIKGSVINLN